MKYKNYYILVVSLLLLTSCAKDESRFEIIVAEKGVIRLDKKTGEMISVSEYRVPALIDIAALKEEKEIDPLLSPVRAFPDFQLPGSKKDITVKLQYRWMMGRMDYRILVTPYIEGLNSAFREKGTSFIILLNDSDGFEVRRFEAPLATLIQIVGPDGNPAEWQAEGSLAITKAEFMRIVGISYTWRYSDILKKALEE